MQLSKKLFFYLNHDFHTVMYLNGQWSDRDINEVQLHGRFINTHPRCPLNFMVINCFKSFRRFVEKDDKRLSLVTHNDLGFTICNVLSNTCANQLLWVIHTARDRDQKWDREQDLDGWVLINYAEVFTLLT